MMVINDYVIIYIYLAVVFDFFKDYDFRIMDIFIEYFYYY